MTDSNQYPNRDQQQAANALHAAAAWLQRIGGDEAAVAVVTIHPSAAVGVWGAGQANVRMLPAVDDAGAELCEAVAPSVQTLLELLNEIQRGALADAVAAGGRVQLLLTPASGDLALRLVHDGSVVALGGMISSGSSH